MGVTTGSWLVDRSALVWMPRAADPGGWSQLIARGLVRIAALTRLEVGYSARNADDHRRGFDEPPLSSMPVVFATPPVEERALEVQRLLAGRGQHRALSVPDLMVCATAEVNGLTVLHVDKDFELIAAITGQPVERLSLRDER